MSTAVKTSVIARAQRGTGGSHGPGPIDRFLDAVWMERGLSPNTLAAYRADLTALDRWLEEHESGAHLCESRRPARVHGVPGTGGRTAALDRAPAVELPPILPVPAARGCAARGSHCPDRHAQGRALAAAVAHGGGSRGPVGRSCRERSSRSPRPHHARGALCDRAACVRTREPQARRGEPEPGRAAHRRQGRPRAADSAGRGGRGMGAAVPAGPAGRDPARAADGLPVSRPVAATA